jgi:hypothetical protein
MRSHKHGSLPGELNFFSAGGILDLGFGGQIRYSHEQGEGSGALGQNRFVPPLKNGNAV